MATVAGPGSGSYFTVASNGAKPPEYTVTAKYANTANVSIIVAVNKIDKPGANFQVAFLICAFVRDYNIVPSDTSNLIFGCKQFIVKSILGFLFVCHFSKPHVNPILCVNGCVITGVVDFFLRVGWQ